MFWGLVNNLKHDWHCRLGHPADPVLNVLKDSLNFDKRDNTSCCEICQRSKQTREAFPLSDHKLKNLGDLVHLDLWGPYKVTSFEGFRKIKVFRSDNGTEFVNQSVSKLCSDKGIIHQTSCVYTPQQNGIAERKHRCCSGKDADSSNDFVATQNEEVATLEENVLSGGNLDQNPSSSQGVQNVKRSSRQKMSALLRNGTWELVELPEGRKAIGSKWIYKIKFRSSGEIDRYKARLVAQGFGQKEGIDYEETFSPVVKMVTVSQSKSDYSLYTKSDKGVFLSLLVYVDDIIITGNRVSEIEKFKVFLKSKFMIKDLGKLKYFLGIEVVDTDKGICLNQRKYVLDLLSDYGMLACKPTKTPLMSKLVISNEASDKDPLLENITDYQEIMGKLIYLTNTRRDISYVVHCLSQFMHSPLTSHLKIAFKILRYLKSCPGLGVHITQLSGMFLTAYSDVDWAKCVVIRKFVTGYCVFLNNSLVFWKSKKQNTLSKSSTEAEYRTLVSVTSEVIWILNFLKDLQIENLLPVSLHCDSNSAIKIAANPVFHERTKHLEIDLHFVREKVLKGVVKTVKVESANQIADILTKGLDTIQHLDLVKKIGLAQLATKRNLGRYLWKGLRIAEMCSGAPMKPTTKLRKFNFDSGVKVCVSGIVTAVDVLMTPPSAFRLNGIAETCPGVPMKPARNIYIY
ncbi:ribonuclease H-like domain-containing protein [Tanacetum coccineum]